MQNTLFILGLFLTSTSTAFSQSETLDKEKYADCRLIIPIDYKNLEKDYEEAKKHEGVEIILFRTSGKGKIKTIERGYVRNREKNGIRTVHKELTLDKDDDIRAMIEESNAHFLMTLAQTKTTIINDSGVAKTFVVSLFHSEHGDRPVWRATFDVNAPRIMSDAESVAPKAAELIVEKLQDDKLL